MRILLIVVFCSFFISAYSQRDNAKLYPIKDVVSRYHNDWTQKHYKQRIKVFKNDPLEMGDIVFIGNSITEKGRDWSEKFNIANVSNRGIAGDVTDGVLKRLPEIVYFKPKAVFILIGINDLFNKHYKEGNGRFKYDKIVPSAEYVAKNILKMSRYIKRKSPETKVYVRTILPTRRGYVDKDILQVNEIIRVSESKGFYTMIDLYKEFVDEKGELMKEMTVDGVHLSPKGYAKWVAFEKPVIKKIVDEY